MRSAAASAGLMRARAVKARGGAKLRSSSRTDWMFSGAALRTELYNLYHVLNHANLFGGGYARQARASIDRLLAEAGA